MRNKQQSPCIQASHEEEHGTHPMFANELLDKNSSLNSENLVMSHNQVDVADRVAGIHDSS